jgi:dolichol-phosphate mannosyltransferase
LKLLHSEDDRVHFISLSRNFGHQAALKSGLDVAKGDCVISMDADLQHPPELIPELIQKWQEGFDIVVTTRKDDRKGSFLNRWSSRSFYRILNALSDMEISPGSADFRLLDRSAVDVIKTLPEPSPFLRGIIHWMGFRVHPLSYESADRLAGQSKYSPKKMVSFAISGITSFSIKPLQISTYLGLFTSAASFLYALYAIGLRIFSNRAIPGWTSVLASVLFIGGAQLIILGIIGQYLGMLFLESKKRPGYIVMETSLKNR